MYNKGVYLNLTQGWVHVHQMRKLLLYGKVKGLKISSVNNFNNFNNRMQANDMNSHFENYWGKFVFAGFTLRGRTKKNNKEKEEMLPMWISSLSRLMAAVHIEMP